MISPFETLDAVRAFLADTLLAETPAHLRSELRAAIKLLAETGAQLDALPALLPAESGALLDLIDEAGGDANRRPPLPPCGRAGCADGPTGVAGRDRHPGRGSAVRAARAQRSRRRRSCRAHRRHARRPGAGPARLAIGIRNWRGTRMTTPLADAATRALELLRPDTLLDGLGGAAQGTHAVVDPARDAVVFEAPLAGGTLIDAAVGRAAAARQGWAADPAVRAAALTAMADAVAGARSALAHLLALETGLPLAVATDEISVGEFFSCAAARLMSRRSTRWLMMVASASKWRAIRPGSLPRSCRGMRRS
ncbi:aldehyde dehydrogenase family protein [Novosphingobium colocasiae]